jgi:hypothetical protein
MESKFSIDIQQFSHEVMTFRELRCARNIWRRKRRSRIRLTTRKAMLYAAGIPNKEQMKKSPHIGIASVWWEGNPCK